METWESLTQGRVFISDLGEGRQMEVDGEIVTVGQYAVWSPTKGGKTHQVVEVGEDLEALMKKYRIPDEMVFTLVHGR